MYYKRTKQRGENISMKNIIKDLCNKMKTINTVMNVYDISNIIGLERKDINNLSYFESIDEKYIDRIEKLFKFVVKYKQSKCDNEAALLNQKIFKNNQSMIDVLISGTIIDNTYYEILKQRNAFLKNNGIDSEFVNIDFKEHLTTIVVEVKPENQNIKDAIRECIILSLKKNQPINLLKDGKLYCTICGETIINNMLRPTRSINSY